VPPFRCDILDVAATFQENGLSAEFLRHYCDTDDLEQVHRLEITVDGVNQSIEPIGSHLPNLRQLRLVNSSVLSVRDLGTELCNIQVLWMSRCGLQDIGGLTACLPRLCEFYIPFNDVSDLSPLNGHENLEVLDIEGNAVCEVDEVEVLRTCPRLREITLTGNPVVRARLGAMAPLSRKDIQDLLPQIQVLDDEDLFKQQQEPSGSTRAPTLHDPDSDPEFDLKLFLSDPCVGDGAVCTGRLRADAALDEDEMDARDSDNEDRQSSSSATSIELIDECRGHRRDAYRKPIRPLKVSHPLLAEGLSRSSLQESSGTGRNPYADEPDEVELVAERLKRPNPSSLPHGHTDRPKGVSFNLQMADRRQVRTVPTSFRPSTGSDRLHLDDLQTGQDSSSDLTCGGSLAGGPLAAVRARRHQASRTTLSIEADMDIHELLRRYQTYTQATMAPPPSKRSEAPAHLASTGCLRPCTPDVRIRTLGTRPATRPHTSAVPASHTASQRRSPSRTAPFHEPGTAVDILELS